MPKYAAETTVSTSATQREIEATLKRYGATAFAYGWDQKGAVIGFEMQGRKIRFLLPLPNREAPEFVRTPNNRTLRDDQTRDRFWEQACRQRWRALTLIIKAKLEAVESGIVTLEDEFLAHVVVPGGQTVGEWMRPQLVEAYRTGRIPALLPGLDAPALPDGREER